MLNWLKRLIAPATPPAETAPQPVAAPAAPSPERQAALDVIEAYRQFLVGKYSVVQDSTSLPHPKTDIQRALRGEIRAALEARDWASYDKLKSDAIMLTNFQDFGLCKAREQTPETVMISEVRLLMTELDDMAMRLGEPNSAERTAAATSSTSSGRS